MNPAPDDPRSGRVRSPAIWKRKGTRSGLIGGASTIVVFALLSLAVTQAPGWPDVRRSFLDVGKMREAFPEIVRHFGTNVKVFILVEVAVLTLGLLVAVVRTVPGPALMPFRLLGVMYTDVFRGLPTLLLIFLFGFGVPPAFKLERPWNSPILWASVALTLNYGAYVAEVFRSGINSVHPSQMAAARSLGLSQWQAYRFVVVPQATRRVIPPLLNDFVALQKDSALIAAIGPIEALRQAYISTTKNFNFSPYLAAGLLFLAITIPLARFADYLVRRSESGRR